MSILVIDVGTSSVRAAVVRPDGTLDAVHQQATPPITPFPGLVELDAATLATAALEVARASLAEGGPVDAVGVANQRASTIVWDRETGRPLAPGLGWQDLRTVGTCLELQAEGFRLAPNASATKLVSSGAISPMGLPSRRPGVPSSASAERLMMVIWPSLSRLSTPDETPESTVSVKRRRRSITSLAVTRPSRWRRSSAVILLKVSPRWARSPSERLLGTWT